jgi:hypothetical protein
LLGNKEDVYDVGARPVLEICIGVRGVVYASWNIDDVVVYSIS